MRFKVIFFLVMLFIWISPSVGSTQSSSEPDKYQMEIKQLEEQVKSLGETIKKNESERGQMQSKMDFMANKLESLENAPKLNGFSINLFAVVVAVFTLTIFVATAYFVVRTIQFRSDAKEELTKIKEMRTEIENAKAQLISSTETTLEKVEMEKNSVIEKIKMELESELKRNVERASQECESKMEKLKEDISNEKQNLVRLIENSLGKELKNFKDTLYNYTGLPIDGIAKGNEELANSNFKLAEVYYMQELFKDPNQANAWVALALAYSGMENYNEALNTIQTAIKLDKSKPIFNKEGQVSVIHAEILMKLYRYKEAREVLEEVLAVNPDFKKAQKLLDDCNKRSSVD